MGRDTAVIVAFVGALLLLSPFILFFTIAVFDTLGIDRMLPDPLFYIIVPLFPTILICSILALVMKLLRKPTSWMKMALSRIALIAYFVSYLLMSLMQAK
ncbi:hypothetical protein [Thermococcus sp.]